MKTLIALTVFSVLASVASAADNPYAGQEERPIKALSEQEISDYLHGRGMGTSKAAELNHYPGPRHVLDHAAALGLSGHQKSEAQRIYDAMEKASSRIGQQIVQKEAELEALYASQRADAGNTRRVVDELAALQAQFRLAHLDAHLAMKQVLSPQQIAAYDRVRGYGSTKSHEAGHKHH